MNVILDETDEGSLILAFVGGHAPEAVSEHRIERWLEWCRLSLVYAGLVELVMRGELKVTWPEGKSEPSFTAGETTAMMTGTESKAQAEQQQQQQEGGK